MIMGDQRGGRTEMRSFTERRRSCEKRISLTKGEDVTGETGETPAGGSMLQGGGGGASAAWGGKEGRVTHRWEGRAGATRGRHT